MEVERLHIFVEGRVQGVGFRYCTAREASALGLSGWVRNLHDGRVEAEFEGPKEALLAILDWCRKGPSFSHVTRLEDEWSTGKPRHSGFFIR